MNAYDAPQKTGGITAVKTGQTRSQVWRRHVEAFQKSGLTRPAYCRKHRIRVSQLDYWRRKLSSAGIGEEAAQWVPIRAQEAINQIRQLFDIERQLKRCTPEERLTLRNQRSRKIVEDFHEWLLEIRPGILPKSLLGTAVTYGLNQWENLVRFLEDGRVELDNNRAERSIKPFVIGRKNWLFANTPKGARASATIYSIIETARENRLNPYAYLNLLFEILPNLDSRDDATHEALLPWNVKLP